MAKARFLLVLLSARCLSAARTTRRDAMRNLASQSADTSSLDQARSVATKSEGIEDQLRQRDEYSLTANKFNELTKYRGAVFFGHQNPDTDSVGEAYAAAEFYGGIAACPMDRSKCPNAESKFLMDEFQVPTGALPPLSEIPDLGDRQVVLVDFNGVKKGPQGPDPSQFANVPAVAALVKGDSSGWDETKVIGIIDHHALQLPGARSEGPQTFYDIADGQIVETHPWGCGCSIMALKFRDSGRKPSKAAAGLMLGGILSDTLGMTGPTRTDFDWQAVTYLKEQTKISDLDSFYDKQATAKSSQNLVDPLEEVFEADLKDFDVQVKGVTDLVIGAVEMYGEENYEAMLNKSRGSEGKHAWANTRSRPIEVSVYVWIIDTKNKRSTLMTDSGRGLCLAKLAASRKSVAMKDASKECRDDNLGDVTSNDFAVFIPFGECVSRKAQAQPLLESAIRLNKC